MTPSEMAKAAIATTVLGLGVAIMARVTVPQPAANRRSTRVDWPDGSTPAGTTCVQLTGLTTPQVRALYGLDVDGGLQYAHAVICGVPTEDGAHPGLPPGMVPLEVTEETVTPGSAQLQAWLPGEAGGFRCACRASATCEARRADGTWAAAPSGVTFQAGAWRGAGCWPKPCVELSGFSSWPPECGPDPMPADIPGPPPVSDPSVDPTPVPAPAPTAE